MQLAAARSDVSLPHPLRESCRHRVLGDDPWVAEAARRGGRYGIKAYTAREWDPEINLYYYRARYYDPKIGRFISEDPITWMHSLSQFAYVGNNPLIFIDPSGEAALTNNSGRPIPYKPEGEDGTIRICLSGQTCDVDGVYPPDCDDYPIKIVDGCTGEVTMDGKLRVVCPIFDRSAPGKRKFPRLGQLLTGGRTNKDFHDKNTDWPPPNDQPNCGCE